MSFDLRVERDCPHRVVEEQVFLDADKRTVRFIRPPRNTENVILEINGNEIPSDRYTFEIDEYKVDGSLKLILKEEIKEVNPLIELTYDTDRRNCRRCHGLGREFDFSFGNVGLAREIIKEDKLVQDCVKWCFANLGSDTFFDFIGTLISQLVGKKNLGIDYIRSEIGREVREALERLRRLQIKQKEYQNVALEEMIDAITSVDVIINQQDPTLIDVQIGILTMAGNSVEVEKKLVVPQLKQILYG